MNYLRKRDPDNPDSGIRRRIRVLVVLKSLPSRSTSNKSEAIWSVLDILEECGFDLSVMAWGRSEGLSFNPAEVQIAPKWVRFVARKLFALIRKSGFRAVAENLECGFVRLSLNYKEESIEKFDVCLALNHSSSPSLIALQIREKWGIPFVVREHQIVENRLKSSKDFLPQYLRSLRLCSGLFAVSPFLANQLEQLDVRSPISVIPNSVSDELIVSPQAELTLDENLLAWGEGAFVFGAWTRWRTIKRLDLLLDSFLEVSKELPEVKLLIAGRIEGRNQERLVRRFKSKLGMKDSLFLYGQATRPEIRALARWVDSVVLSSDYETFGLPALEGMFAGKPVVTTVCNGPEYLISKPFLGETSTRGSAQDLASAMTKVYRSRHQYSAERIQSHARANFSKSALAPIWASAISRAVMV